jgi:hypothetical protein
MGVSNKLTSFVAGVMAAGLFASSVQATIIDNGLTTIDSTQHLEWLDLTETVGRSYNDVAGQFEAGGDYEGWRYAVASELASLFAEAGLPTPVTDINGSTAHGANPQLKAFIELIGPTFYQAGQVSGGIYRFSGRFNDLDLSNPTSGTAGGSFDNRLFTDGTLSDTGTTYITTNAFRASPTRTDVCGPSSGPCGSFLVRSTAVPEPGVLTILGLGFAGLAYARRTRAA